MPLVVDITALGDKQLAKDLAKLEPKLQKKALRQALRTQGKQVLKDTKEMVPRDTGALRKALKLRSLKRSRKELGVYVFIDKQKLREEVRDDGSFYPSAVEYGSAKRGLKPQPYLRPAFDRNEESSLSRIRAAIADFITKEMKK